MKKNKTILDATREWVGGFNAISSSLLERAFKNDIDSWVELTPITVGDTVYYNGDYIRVNKTDLVINDYGTVSGKSKLFLDQETKISTNLSEELLTAIYVDNKKLDIIDYNFKKNVFILEDNTEIGFEAISKVVYKDEDCDVELDANVSSIEKYDSDFEDIEYEFELELQLSETVVDYYDVDKEYDGWLPMWGTLWTFSESCDDWWVKENLETVAQCGFRIFEDQETGEIYIGIDGAGYNFYEAHWVPLYKARGLMWHNNIA